MWGLWLMRSLFRFLWAVILDTVTSILYVGWFISLRGVSGVCLEDKAFPKSNSLSRAGQTLVRVDEFVGKIRAAVDHRADQHFCIVARTELFICGCSLSEVHERRAGVL
jgi:2-methylisocitrate lyase-like PEP mutase family enzyme